MLPSTTNLSFTCNSSDSLLYTTVPLYGRYEHWAQFCNFNNNISISSSIQRVHLHKCIKECNVIMSVWPQPEIWPECTAEKLSAHQGHHLIFLNTEGEPVSATRPKKKYSVNSITLAAFTFLVTVQSPQWFRKLSYKKWKESTSLPNQTHASFTQITL